MSIRYLKSCIDFKKFVSFRSCCQVIIVVDIGLVLILDE